MDAAWSPDVRTLDWGLATIDEPAVGDAIIAQLVQRIPEIATIDRALLGEAAVESVLFTLIADAEGDSEPAAKPD